MSDINDTHMEVPEGTSSDTLIVTEEKEHEMEEPNTSEAIEEDMHEASTSEIIRETSINDSETIDEILSETASDMPAAETPVIKSKQFNTRLPLARIKQIMKFDPDCSIISKDGLLLISKATEMFIEFLGKEACKHTLNNKKKTIMKKDVEAAIDCSSNLYFLDGALEWD